MRVLFRTKYPRKGASSRYRVLQFIPYLEREGFDCDVQSLHTEEYLDSFFSGGRLPLTYYAGRLLERAAKVLKASQYSAVFIQKELFPYAPPLAEIFFRMRRIKVIYDIDDAIYLFYTKTRNPFVRFLLRQKVPKLIGSSSVVLAGNAFLRDYALRYCPRTVLFPTVIDPSRYDVSYADIKERDGGFRGAAPVIGWIGTPAMVEVLREKREILKRAAERFPFRLLVIGAPGFTLPGLDI
ncbi:MAG: hypothetical protein KAX38_02955, partial [Candidatus Krumholzibacteria bacterium]|nr:hypothetical protein [Candidatus Krumholzibacteria bacterium]